MIRMFSIAAVVLLPSVGFAGTLENESGAALDLKLSAHLPQRAAFRVAPPLQSKMGVR